MRTPDAYLKDIEKLRALNESNFQKCRWRENDTVRQKIITAWAGYHAAVSKQLDKIGCPVGTEHLDYSQSLRIKQLADSREFYYRRLTEAEGLLSKYKEALEKIVDSLKLADGEKSDPYAQRMFDLAYQALGLKSESEAPNRS